MPRTRLVSGQLALVLLSTLGTLASFYLLLSVTPMYAASAGAGSTGAGLVTGVLLLGTVAAELASSLLMKRYGYRIVLAAGAVLMGVPALALLSPRSLIIIMAVSAVRGFGFGLTTVVLGALTALMVPPERRGEGLGLLGIADTVPAIVALPAGVWLAGHYGYPVVVCLTAASALVPLAAFPWLPGRTGGRTSPGHADAAKPTGVLASLRHGRLLPLSVIFAVSTMTAGVVASFLPLVNGISGNVAAAGLLTQALAATICQWWAGRIGDRHGHARLLIPGLALGSLGMIAMLWLTSPAVLITAMCLFGAGFGLLLNATFVLMIDRMPASAVGTASAVWSLAYDAGYGAGPVLFGLIVGHTGFPAAFALTTVVMLAAVPLARREHFAGPGEPTPAPGWDARRLTDTRCQ